jgi:hypothetical protein
LNCIPEYGESSHIKGSEIEIKIFTFSRINGVTKVIRLTEVLHVPEICRNLVSVSQLTKKGAIVTYENDVVMIHINDSLLIRGKKSGSKLF